MSSSMETITLPAMTFWKFDAEAPLYWGRGDDGWHGNNEHFMATAEDARGRLLVGFYQNMEDMFEDLWWYEPASRRPLGNAEAIFTWNAFEKAARCALEIDPGSMEDPDNEECRLDEDMRDSTSGWFRPMKDENGQLYIRFRAPCGHIVRVTRETMEELLA